MTIVRSVRLHDGTKLAWLEHDADDIRRQYQMRRELVTEAVRNATAEFARWRGDTFDASAECNGETTGKDGTP